MSTLKSWLHAARPRTLALSLSCVSLGGILAYADQSFDFRVFLLTILTTVLLQVLSNFANDYGDYTSGVDLQGRIGPERAMQSGQINQSQMKMGIGITAVLSLLSGIYLLMASGLSQTAFYVLLGIGFLAIVAAITYTMGKNPYGYRGLGDLFVFIFFGLVGVLGTHYLIYDGFLWRNIWPAIAIGSLAVGVLNLNNMRDLEADKRSGKNTLPVHLGISRAKQYHYALILISWMCLIIYSFLHFVGVWQFLFVLMVPVFIKHIKAVQGRIGGDLDPLLKQLSLSTLGLVVLFGLGWIVSYGI
ncbi:1,4-dihydroxy-2-naphthoate octaprenyltransferase [Membranihabitans marinus]|uniref:1,4-dihydroxy-2-naphthoate octaprenyltransferase n=1 Tax=Membranihabitans marinus TaxID=1227546 RepID=UPI001F02D0B7|nr:1,4-dihydroxy-2-naphthoate octaprenyltransferase [Membranihabitans marinus]